MTPAMAKDVNGLVNMYRITGDDWDTWGDVAAHFDISRWISLSMGIESLELELDIHLCFLSIWCFSFSSFILMQYCSYASETSLLLV